MLMGWHATMLTSTGGRCDTTVTSYKRHGVSNHHRLDCLFSSFQTNNKRKSNSTSLAFCNYRWPGYSSQRPGMWKVSASYDVIMDLNRSTVYHRKMQFMMTSSKGNIFRVTGPLWGESTGHRTLTSVKVKQPCSSISVSSRFSVDSYDLFANVCK